MEYFKISELLQTRREQRSFHVASESNVRIEFRNMRAGEKLPPFSCAGNLVLTIFAGEFSISDGVQTKRASELDQLVTPEDAPLAIECVVDGTLQIIWTPPFASVESR